MTLQEAKSIARHLGLTLRKVRSGDYRVNFPDADDSTAYYTTISKTPSMPQWRWPESAYCQPTPRKVPCGHVGAEQSHDQIRETLFTLWWKVRPYLPPPLGPALLPQSLQRQLHCKGREGLCTPEKVVWLLPHLCA